MPAWLVSFLRARYIASPYWPNGPALANQEGAALNHAKGILKRAKLGSASSDEAYFWLANLYDWQEHEYDLFINQSKLALTIWLLRG